MILLTEELSVELDLGQPLVKTESRGCRSGHKGLVVAVVRVTKYRQDVAHSEEDGGHPCGPEQHVYLVIRKNEQAVRKWTILPCEPIHEP